MNTVILNSQKADNVTCTSAVNNNLRSLRKEEKRIKRIARLYSITTSYSYFEKMQLYGSVSNSKNDYKEAEKWADFSNFIFGDIKHATPEDFIYNRNEMANKAIDYHEKYINVLNLIDKSSIHFGLNSKTVDAFCKRIKYGHECIILSSIGHLQYPGILAACISYMGGYISIEEFRKSFVWISFSMKPEPINIKLFIKQMRSIEKVYNEIEDKQNKRNNNSKKCNTMGKSDQTFGDMTIEEINQWEKKSGGIVLFGDETCVSFQKPSGDDGVLVILLDGVKNPIHLDWVDTLKLKQFLNTNF